MITLRLRSFLWRLAAFFSACSLRRRCRRVSTSSGRSPSSRLPSADPLAARPSSELSPICACRDSHAAVEHNKTR